jgi:predicted ATP-dependent serine protease
LRVAPCPQDNACVVGKAVALVAASDRLSIQRKATGPIVLDCFGEFTCPRKEHPPFSTGIAGLDQILRGELPRSNIYLLQGSPGAGKTTAALQFLKAGVAEGERCIYVSLSQTAAELRAIAKSHRWSLDGIKIAELAASDAIASAADQTI